jgi:outer membrane murein-binding lipoprotein Lpp
MAPHFSTTSPFTGKIPATPRLAAAVPCKRSRLFNHGILIPSERKDPTSAEHVANLEAHVNQLGSEVETLRFTNHLACNDADRLRSRVAELEAGQAKSNAYQAIMEATLAIHTRPTASSPSDSPAPKVEQSRPHQQQTEPLLINGVLLGRFIDLDEFIAATSGTAPVMETGRRTEPSRSNTVVPQTCKQGRDSAFSDGPDFNRPMSFDEFALIFGSSGTKKTSALSTENGRYPGILAPKPIHPRAPLLDMAAFC